MSWFWIAAGGMTVIVVALLLLALRRGGAEGAVAAADLRVYRDQMREIDRDVARGVVVAADAERLKTEIARRILAADAAMAQGALRVTPVAARRVGAVAIVAVVLAGSILVYREVGAPAIPTCRSQSGSPRRTRCARGGPDRRRQKPACPPCPPRPRRPIRATSR